MRLTGPSRRWFWFSAWALAGAGYAMGISQLGLFTIPAAALLTFGLVRSGATGREMLGLVEGVGGVGVFVGVTHLDYKSLSSCSPEP